ncbi:Phosphatidylinositolglycan class N-domain-containing protein [Hyaloraphidium curvatum]|nr:Phosphatidylinositolglycan class N-domain-containing protein [Hyaloraphidium curvatum]
MEPVDPPRPAPASRLVLIVADGLRADKLFGNRLEMAPFLRSVVEGKGTWGVSHTHVPTESRPGHVALIAGMYEDVSAVTKGWKSNPVDFDSVFNRSSHTWSFGSPDILPMFAHGASPKDKVDMFMYEDEDEDFSKDASWLDTWVFDKVEELFRNASSNPELSHLMRQDRIVFFLHLLGLDTNGHAFRPHSDTYLGNIRLVDSRLPALVDLFEGFYGDRRTAYVFTADHGMNSRGAHGDGDKENTETPLICWGSGVAGPRGREELPGPDENGWKLEDLSRHDVEQADVAPLMSTLLGLPPPMNSVGKLPIAFLDPALGDEFAAKAALANARQVHAQLVVKEEAKRRTELWFSPFPALAGGAGDDLLARAEALATKGRFAESERVSMNVVDLSIQGSRYYQTYDWLFLRTVVSLGYLGWISFSSIWTVMTFSSGPVESSPSSWDDMVRSRQARADRAGVLAASLMAALLLYKRSPFMYYVYVAFPIFFWRETAKQLPVLWRSLLSKWTRNEWATVSAGLVVYGSALLCLTVSYFDRRVLAACFTALAAGYALVLPSPVRAKKRSLVVAWTVSCVAAGWFALLPVDLPENLTLINLGTGLIAGIGLVAARSSDLMVIDPLLCGGAPAERQRKDMLRLLAVQITMVVLAGALVNLTSKAFERRDGLPIPNQLAAWVIAFGSMLVPFTRLPILGLSDNAHDVHYLFRLVTVFLAFAPCYVLLTISYEALFYGVFCAGLLSWLLLEQCAHEATKADNASATAGADPTIRSMRYSDLRISLVFLVFLISAFFGTGNIASVASFSMESVRRFQSVFNPFVMGALLIFRVLVPYFALSAAFGVLSRCVDLPAHALFLLTISTTDIMTLRFFYLVRDSGSWLEIGTSISHFVISSGLLVFSMILFGISSLLVDRIIVVGLQ